MHERSARIRHLPGVVYRRGPASAANPDALRADVARAVTEHLRRVGTEATYVEPTAGAPARVRYRVRGAPRVSIIIPTVGTVSREVGGRTIDLLANTVRSIAERTEYPHYQIVYVHDRPLRAETAAVLDATGVDLRAIPYDRPFNWSDKMNVGAAAASGEHLLALNDDVEVIDGDWLSALLEFSQQAAVGAVGAKLLFPDGSIQHAGVVVDAGTPRHPYHGLPRDRQVGVADLDAVRNYSAVTGACLMTRADVFREVGGFAPTFPVNYNDVDYCLKVRARGYRVVFTPHARLYHYESVSRAGAANSGVRPEEPARFAREWPDVVVRDPYHDVRRQVVWPR
jgi:glycosyltransferase involved in cell wall biosynthesis